jgi:Fe-S-cluster containining protein
MKPSPKVFGKALQLGKCSREKVIRWLVSAQESLEKIPTPQGRAKFLYKISDTAILDWKKNDPTYREMVPCGKMPGDCSMCCHASVQAHDDEIELLADLVVSGKVTIDLELLKKQILVTGGGNEIRDWFKLPWAERRCVFLGQDKKCSVYEDRPMVCRKWFVAEVDNSHCHEDDHFGGIAYVEKVEAFSAAGSAYDTTHDRLPMKLYRVLVRRGFIKEEK